MPALKITGTVFGKIQRTIGTYPAETGGMLGAKDGIITEFYFDESANSSAGTYSPNTKACETVLNEIWMPNQVSLCGFIHSHRSRYVPSAADKDYIIRIKNAIDCSVPFFLVILSSSSESGQFALYPYSVPQFELLPYALVP